MEGLEGLPNWKVTRGAHEHEYIQPHLFSPLKMVLAYVASFGTQG